MTNQFDIDTSKIKVGDRVGFKYDVEQYSVVKGVKNGGWDSSPRFLVTVTAGGYKHGDLWLHADDIFDHRTPK